MVIFLVTVSYLVGQSWFLFCQFSIRSDEYIEAHPNENNENFLTHFEMIDSPGELPTVKLTYFAFTTLSTVGFGDFHPRSDRERLLIVFIFLVGVNLTSFVMDTLNKVLN